MLNNYHQYFLIYHKFAIITLFVVLHNYSYLYVCLRLSAVAALTCFCVSNFVFWAAFQGGFFPCFWEGLSGFICLSVLSALTESVYFVFVCVFSVFSGCRRNLLLRVRFWLLRRGNESALAMMVTLSSVAGSCLMPLWTLTLCVCFVVRRSGAGIAPPPIRAGSVLNGQRSNGKSTWPKGSTLTVKSQRLLILLRSRRSSVDRHRRLLVDRRSRRRSRLLLRDRSM